MVPSTSEVSSLLALVHAGLCQLSRQLFTVVSATSGWCFFFCQPACRTEELCQPRCFCLQSGGGKGAFCFSHLHLHSSGKLLVLPASGVSVYLCHSWGDVWYACCCFHTSVCEPHWTPGQEKRDSSSELRCEYYSVLGDSTYCQSINILDRNLQRQANFGCMLHVYVHLFTNYLFSHICGLGELSHESTRERYIRGFGFGRNGLFDFSLKPKRGVTYLGIICW